jgi:hypothetical protein
MSTANNVCRAIRGAIGFEYLSMNAAGETR